MSNRDENFLSFWIKSIKYTVKPSHRLTTDATTLKQLVIFKQFQAIKRAFCPLLGRTQPLSWEHTHTHTTYTYWPLLMLTERDSFLTSLCFYCCYAEANSPQCRQITNSYFYAILLESETNIMREMARLIQEVCCLAGKQHLCKASLFQNLLLHPLLSITCLSFTILFPKMPVVLALDLNHKEHKYINLDAHMEAHMHI